MQTTSIFRRRLPVLAAAAMAATMAFAGTANALPGSGKVDSNDLRANVTRSVNIKNGEVKRSDLAIGSVISSTVADGSLSGTDIEDGSLTGEDIDDGSLTGADVANDSLTGDDIKESTLQGVMANQTRFVFATSAVTAGPPTGIGAQVSADCPANEKAIGGGAAWIIPGFGDGNVPTALNAPITASMPKVGTVAGVGAATGWTALGRNMSGTNRVLRAYAICVPKTVQ
jgi:hypothetical protein